MNGFWGLTTIIALFAVFLGGIPWLAHRVRHRGIGGGVLGPIQDLWDPAVYREQTHFEVQKERKAPAPAPDDPPWDEPLRR
jgi:hypothetical protein